MHIVAIIVSSSTYVKRLRAVLKHVFQNVKKLACVYVLLKIILVLIV